MPNLFPHGWFGHCLALFALTFLHENAAIVAAAFSHAEYGLPPGLALFSVYTGTLASDLTIYALGRTAHRNRWLREHAIGPRVAHLGYDSPWTGRKNWLRLTR